MSGIMSLALTAIGMGVGPGLVAQWLGAWGMALAFPLVLLLFPPIRALVAALTD